MDSPSTSFALPAPTAVRALARAFSAFHEFDNFVQGLQKALDHTNHFDRLTIQMDAAILEAPAHFSPGTLTLPLAGERGPLGSLQVGLSKQQRQFGPEDLHLMAGLADFLSAVLTQAAKMQELARNRDLLRLLLNQVPFGIAAYDSEQVLVVANELAIRWIGTTVLPFEDFEKGGGGFHLRASGKLIYGEPRRSADDANGLWIVALHDLTPEQVRLLELMQRETYRMLAQGGRLGFALVESTHLRDGVLRRLGVLRAALLPGEIAGPYDAHRIGIVFPGLNGLALRARLRKLRSVFAETSGLRLGYAELGRDGDTPEAILTAALQRHGAYDEIIRPVLLIHDDSAAVADTFAMVLGKEFFVMKSTSSIRTRELLAKEIFEGFVTELELRNEVSGLDLVRYAREKQPGIRPFFTTVQRAPYGLPAGVTEAEASVLEKPFDIATLTRIVRAKLLD